MPLIPSPRHRPEDLTAWEAQSRYDARMASTVAGKTLRAQQVLRRFAQEGDCYLGTSWGKDSTVLAHLAATSGLILPLVWVRVDRWENPDCEAVRDAFLTRWGDHVIYTEIVVASAAPRRWEADDQGTARTSSTGFEEAARRHGRRHISGVRAEESTTRRMTVRRNGEASATTCRPLAHWSGQDIFAYLTAHDLPVHPAYAMNFAGSWDRSRIRVGSLGGERGTGMGRSEWERRYYGDVLDQQ